MGNKITSRRSGILLVNPFPARRVFSGVTYYLHDTITGKRGALRMAKVLRSKGYSARITNIRYEWGVYSNPKVPSWGIGFVIPRLKKLNK